MPELTERLVDGIRWRVLPEYQELLFPRTGQTPNEWIRNGLAHVVKHGPHRTVYRVALPGLEVYVKHFRLAGARSLVTAVGSSQQGPHGV